VWPLNSRLLGPALVFYGVSPFRGGLAGLCRGESFHFAPRWKSESFLESLCRHEWYLGSRLNVQPGERILDVGCGVGGPMRNIARFTKARVTGINNNAYQVKRVAAKNAAEKLSEQCDAVKGDFMNMPFEDNTFDGVYAIEATVHAPDRTGCYSEIYRVLKPGRLFAAYVCLARQLLCVSVL
jgi:sterol 24-C-methyltransferase